MRRAHEWVACACCTAVLVCASLSGCTKEERRGKPLSSSSGGATSGSSSSSGTVGGGGSGGMAGGGGTGGAIGGGTGGMAGGGGTGGMAGGGTGGTGGSAPTAKALWSDHSADAGEEFAAAVATDAAGNIVVAGSFTGSIKLGGGFPLTAAGGQDIYVAMLDKDGKHLWSKSFGDLDNDQVRAVAVDSAGSVVVVGDFRLGIDFGGGLVKSAGSADLFVVKFNKDGSWLWTRTAGATLDQTAYDVAIDGNDDVVVTGSFADSMDLGDAGGGGSGGSGTELTAVDSDDIFVARLDMDGKHLWSKSFGDIDSQQVRAVALDKSGNIGLTGTYKGKLSFGGSTFSNSSGDAFVAVLSPLGGHVWSASYGGADVQQGLDVAYDSWGNLLVVGWFGGSITIGTSSYNAKGSYDAFVLKIDPTGQPLWTKTFGDVSSQKAVAVAVDSGSNIVVAGENAGTIDFGGGPLVASSEDVFVVAMDGNGKHLWSEQWGDVYADHATRIVTDPFDQLVMVGDFTDDIAFVPSKPLKTPSLFPDLFVVKLVSASSGP